VVISLDGSEDNCKEPVSHICAHTPKPLLISIVRNEAKIQSSEVLFEDLLKCKEYLEKQNVDPILFSHDNENKMIKLGEIWENKTGKGHFGCAPHAINLINKKVFELEKYAKFVQSSAALQNKIRNSKCKQFLSKYKQEEFIKNKIQANYPNIDADSSEFDQKYNEIKNSDKQRYFYI
jgi:hypothetical protein